MRADQLTRLEALRDRLVEVAITDADPANWVGGGKSPKDMTRDERGDAKWCRGIAVQTVSLTMQVQRLLQNPVVGGAIVPDASSPPASTAETDEEAAVEAEIRRFEAAATAVLDKARASNGKR